MIHSPARAFVRFVTMLVATLTLAACGGGGGSGSSSSSGGSSSSSGGGGNRGEFTLGATTAAIKGLRLEPAPQEVRILVTVTGTGVAAVGAAFVNTPQPPWLQVTLEGTVPNLTLVLRATDTSMQAGHYTSTVTVGTADANGTVLRTREVAITYDLIIGLSATPTPQNLSFVFGSSRTTEKITIDVSAGVASKTWTVTSDQPWITVSPVTRTGDVSLDFTVDGANTGVAPGSTATAHLTFQNTTEPIDRKVVTVNAAIVPPTPIVTTTPVVNLNPLAIGTSNGLGRLSQTLDVSLDTGTNNYPWTLTIDAPQSSGWLVSDVSAGTISGNVHDELTLALGTAIGAAGNYTATAHFDVEVQGQSFRTSIPVTLKWHGQRLVPAQNGIAFSSFPSRPTPDARTIKVTGSRGIDGVLWTASSDQDWLSVTPSGVTGGNLTLTPSPGTLAANTLHIATVTLASTSQNIERSETIRVGYWKGSANPMNLSVALPDFPVAQVVNPVEPYAYSLYGGQIHVYNVYTGAEITTFSGAYLNATGDFVSMDVNSDGTALYIANGGSSRVVAIDSTNGNLLDTWDISPRFQPMDSRIRFARVNGYPILLTPLGEVRSEIIDLESGTLLEQTSQGGLWFVAFDPERVISPDGSRLFSILGSSTSDTVSQYRMVFGTLGGRVLEVAQAGSFLTQDNGFTRQMCVSASGTRLYTQNMSTLTEVAIDVEPPQRLREIERSDYPGTSVQALDCNWSGRLYVALQSFEGDLDNVLVLDADGTRVGSFLSGPLNSGAIVNLMGLTGDSRRMVTTNVEVGDSGPLISINFTSVP